jgi:hypothetical protein
VDGYALDVGDFFQCNIPIHFRSPFHCLHSIHLLDVTCPHIAKHPGGPKPLLQYRGRDATAAFHGILNKHTQVLYCAVHCSICVACVRCDISQPNTV